jgi:hypothetical protein
VVGGRRGWLPVLAMSMCGSKVTPFPRPEKACSGRCLGNCHSGAPKVWVVAACNGMLTLFKKTDHHLEMLAQTEGSVFPTLEVFSHFIRGAVARDEFEQLMIVGSAQDVAWVEMALPEEAARRIVAEMKYPLLPGWFNQAGELTSALERILHP